MATQRRNFTGTKSRANHKKARKEEDFSSWLETLADYVKETQTSTLDLGSKGLEKAEVQSVLNFLSHTQVTELDLKCNCLTKGMVDLAPMLVKTKIQKLNLQACRLREEDVLRLAETLKDTQITDLNLWGNTKVRFIVQDGQKVVSNLRNSKLTTLTVDFFSVFLLDCCRQFTTIFEEFLSSSITSLNLVGAQELSSDMLILLFANLGRSSVTDLNLKNIYIPLEAYQELSRKLAETKIVKLNLCLNLIKDDQYNVLVDGLVKSKVVDFGLQDNSFTSLGPLFTRLSETQIQTLNLRGSYRLANEKLLYVDSLRHSSLVSLDLRDCKLSDEAGRGLMESLRSSSVTKLDISQNNLGILTVEKFCENINDIHLADLDISLNPLSPDVFLKLGSCLKVSKLTRIVVNSIKSLEPMHLYSFLKLTEGSSVKNIEMSEYPNNWPPSPDCESSILVNTTFTHLNLSSNNVLCRNISNLMRHLKQSCVTYLNLTGNGFDDKAVAVLAKCLRETQIRRLELGLNYISKYGAEALALSFKDSNLLYLHLQMNSIDDEGFQILAKHAKDTFISVLDVSHNIGERVLLVDKVLWRNKIAVDKLVRIFNKIVPKDSAEFSFGQHCDDSYVSGFVEKCLWFYKTIIGCPRAVNVLLEEKNFGLSKEQMFRFVSEEFPRQFSRFIACNMEIDLQQHVNVLKQVEKMGLTAIVESLLLHRPVYMLDKELGVLHPFVYKLLLKYKQPVCNTAVEPCGVMKIIEYFTEYANIEGAQDVINLLHKGSVS